MTETLTEPAPDPGGEPAPAKESMAIDKYERRWIILSITLLVAFFVTVSIAGFAMGFGVPGVDSEVDPRTVAQSKPWSTPGLREISPGKYEAYVISQTWSFSPAKMEVPVGSEVTLYVTSVDVQHGFKITDTNVNMQIVPGQVSKLSFEADKIGEFPYLCTEYCGSGHAAMFGTISVVSQADFEANQAASADSSDSTGRPASTDSPDSTDRPASTDSPDSTEDGS